MLVGNKDRFAIEAQPNAVEQEWVLGRFRFWLGGKPVGDWDELAPLQHCYGWLRRFAQQPPDCVEPSLADKSAEYVFRMLVDSVIGPGGIAAPARQPVPYAYERFHITHIGMSSFDRFTIVLVKDEHGGEWCLWREVGAQIHDCRLWRNEMETVAGQFCDMFDREILKKSG